MRAEANDLYANLTGIISMAARTFNVASTTSGFLTGAANLRNFTNNTHVAYLQHGWSVRSTPALTRGVDLPGAIDYNRVLCCTR